jgi:cell division transport system permease protein
VLQDSTPKAKIKQIYQVISRLPEVKSLEYISKEEALHRLQQKLKMDISLTDLPNNPLPNTFEIQLNNANKISRLAEAIKKMDYVEKVKYGEKIANKVLALNRAVHWVGSLVIIALLICTVFIISNTIRLTVYARRREIKIMQLVGAAFWFIRWPFIMEGMLQGVMGALPALLLVAGLYGLFVPQVQNNLPFIPLLSLTLIFNKMTTVALITGVAVGGIGSLISVNKYLQYE